MSDEGWRGNRRRIASCRLARFVRLLQSARLGWRDRLSRKPEKQDWVQWAATYQRRFDCESVPCGGFISCAWIVRTGSALLAGRVVFCRFVSRPGAAARCQYAGCCCAAALPLIFLYFLQAVFCTRYKLLTNTALSTRGDHYRRLNASAKPADDKEEFYALLIGGREPSAGASRYHGCASPYLKYNDR